MLAIPAAGDSAEEDLRLPLRVVWRSTAGHPTLGSWRAALDSTLLVAPGGRRVLGLAPTTGAVRWQRTMPTGVRIAELMRDSTGEVRLLVGGVVGRDQSGALLADLHALAPQSGALLWSVAAGGVFAPPVLDGDQLIVSSTHALLAVDPTDGSIRWRIEFPRDDTGLPGGPTQAGPLVSHGLVLVGAGDRRLYAMDATSGALRWCRDVSRRPYGPPAIWERSVIWAVGDTLFNLDVADGRVMWRQSLGGQPAVATPVIEDGTVYLATGTGRTVVAIDVLDGRLRWRTEMDALVFSRPALTRTALWVGDVEGRLTALARDDGRLLWRRELAGGFLSDPVIDDGRLVVGAASGELFLFASAPEPVPEPESEPAPPALAPLRVAPNPAHEAVRIFAGAGRVAIYDVRGRRRFGVTLEATDGTGFIWQGTDDAGHRLPAGTYFVRLETDDGARSAKLQLLR